MSKELHNWERGSTYETPEEGGRGLSETEWSAGYEEILGFDAKELEGKKVLDLGSGAKERLSKDLQDRGIGVDLVAVNPDLVDWFARTDIVRESHWEKKSVAAVGQALPFEGDTFDEVLALASVSWYTSPEDEGKQEAAKLWASEIVRVLKEGGKARIYPVSKGDEQNEHPFRDIFSGLGVQIEIEEWTPGQKRAIITKQVEFQD